MAGAVRQLFIGTLLSFCLALGACASTPGTGLLPQGPTALRYQSLDGSYQSLAALRGKVVLVNVITTWSDPALLQVPKLRDIYNDNLGHLEVLCLVLDEDPRMAQIFSESFAPPYRVGTVPNQARFMGKSGPFGPITVIPTSILLDQKGRIAARMDGLWAPGVLEEAIERLRAAGTSL